MKNPNFAHRRIASAGLIIHEKRVNTHAQKRKYIFTTKRLHLRLNKISLTINDVFHMYKYLISIDKCNFCAEHVAVSGANEGSSFLVAEVCRTLLFTGTHLYFQAPNHSQTCQIFSESTFLVAISLDAINREIVTVGSKPSGTWLLTGFRQLMSLCGLVCFHPLRAQRFHAKFVT